MKEKSKHMGKSLFTRYMFFFLVVEVISLAIFGTVLFYFVANAWEDEQKQVLFSYADSVAENYNELLNSPNMDDKQFRLSVCRSISSMSEAAKADIFISDKDGDILFCRETLSNDEAGKVCEYHSKMKIPGEVITGVLADGVLATKNSLGGVLEDESFVSARSVGIGQNSPSCVVFAIQPVESGIKPYYTGFLRTYAMAAFVLIVVVTFIAHVLTYNVTLPLKDMSEATKRYSEGDFSYRIKRRQTHIVTEFDELSAAINSMADSLESLEENRSDFVANISHELKTPITSIGGFVDGILDGTIPPERREHYLKIVSDEVKRLTKLITSMLNISKIEAGELRISPQRFNVTRQILKIFDSFEQKISEKDIHVRGLHHLRDCYIEADPDMINQVFYNLIDNAVKFTDKHGEISIDTNEDNEYLCVTIRNTGKSIDENDIDHIFERFYKGDKSRGLDTNSTGLGLYIVKSIVEMHGGEITANSPEKNVTEFKVKLKLRLTIK